MPRRYTRKARRLPRKKAGMARKRRAPYRRRVTPQRSQMLIKGVIMNPIRSRPIIMQKTMQNIYTAGASALQIDHTGVLAPTSSTFGVQTQLAWPRLDWIVGLELTALQGLYTHYKILGAKYSFQLNAEGFTGVVSGAQYIPPLYVRYNYDAEGFQAVSVAMFQQMNGYKQFNFGGEGNVAMYKIYPRIFPSVYNNVSVGTLTSNATVKPYWFDINHPSIVHPGIAFLMPNLPAGASLTLEVQLTFAVKNQR